MPVLLAFAFAIALNIIRARQGKSTACSTTRKYVPAAVFIAIWAGFNAWFLPHWLLPRLRKHGWF